MVVRVPDRREQMRHYELRLSPRQGWFHPFEQRLDRTEGIRRVAIHRVRLVTDDTGMVLLELAGDAERAEALFDDALESGGYWLETFGDRIFVSASFEPSETVRELLRDRKSVV